MTFGGCVCVRGGGCIGSNSQSEMSAVSIPNQQGARGRETPNALNGLETANISD